MRHNYVRIKFNIKQDECGYPGIDAEIMWAKRVKNGFEIDNIPFYIYGLSCEDIVVADLSDLNMHEFKQIVEPSQHSTIRVIHAKQCADDRPIDERMNDLRRQLNIIGCESEGVRPGFFAIDVPPLVELNTVREILISGYELGLWDYEEATLWHKK